MRGWEWKLWKYKRMTLRIDDVSSLHQPPHIYTQQHGLNSLTEKGDQTYSISVSKGNLVVFWRWVEFTDDVTQCKTFTLFFFSCLSQSFQTHWIIKLSLKIELQPSAVIISSHRPVCCWEKSHLHEWRGITAIKKEIVTWYRTSRICLNYFLGIFAARQASFSHPSFISISGMLRVLLSLISHATLEIFSEAQILSSCFFNISYAYLLAKKVNKNI